MDLIDIRWVDGARKHADYDSGSGRRGDGVAMKGENILRLSILGVDQSLRLSIAIACDRAPSVQWEYGFMTEAMGREPWKMLYQWWSPADTSTNSGHPHGKS